MLTSLRPHQVSAEARTTNLTPYQYRHCITSKKPDETPQLLGEERGRGKRKRKKPPQEPQSNIALAYKLRQTYRTARVLPQKVRLVSFSLC